MTLAIVAGVLNHLWQSTLVLALCGLLGWWLRRQRADVRHTLWLAASVKFVVPSAAFVALGRQIGWPTTTAMPQPAVASVLDSINQPVNFESTLWLPVPSAAGVPAESPDWLLAIVAVWILGCVTQCSLWALRWYRVASLVKRSPILDDVREVARLRRVQQLVGVRRPVHAVVSDGMLEPGVFGILRPVLIWPYGIASRLTDAQADTVLAHELVHVRRNDNLTAALHMAVQAIFWFFPPVWWLEKRLIAERERACDEAVLRMGMDPQLYAEGILKTCEFYVEAPIACVAGVTGSDLKQRVVAIMSRRTGEALTAAGRALLGAVAVVAIALPIALGVLQAPMLRAQVPSVANLPSFEVASIRPNKSAEAGGSFGTRGSQTYLYVVNNTLFNIIRNAYGLQANQIIGGPDWIRAEGEKFDITAKAPEETKPDQMLLMMQALLADRFKLRLHKETRDVPMFALVLARSDRTLGPRMTPAAVDCNALRAAMVRGEKPTLPTPVGDRPACGAQTRPGRLLIGGYPPSDIARQMSVWVGGRPVVDRTGLTGIYDLELTWTPDQPPAARDGAPPLAIDPNGPSLFTAVQEQLGLKLEPTTGPVEMLVIDSAERPTPD
jgi:uncharacterized protein (TIGR03435 family)